MPAGKVNLGANGAISPSEASKEWGEIQSRAPNTATQRHSRPHVPQGRNFSKTYGGLLYFVRISVVFLSLCFFSGNLYIYIYVCVCVFSVKFGKANKLFRTCWQNRVTEEMVFQTG